MKAKEKLSQAELWEREREEALLGHVIPEVTTLTEVFVTKKSDKKKEAKKDV